MLYSRRIKCMILPFFGRRGWRHCSKPQRYQPPLHKRIMYNKMMRIIEWVWGVYIKWPRRKSRTRHVDTPQTEQTLQKNILPMHGMSSLASCTPALQPSPDRTQIHDNVLFELDKSRVYSIHMSPYRSIRHTQWSSFISSTSIAISPSFRPSVVSLCLLSPSLHTPSPFQPITQSFLPLSLAWARPVSVRWQPKLESANQEHLSMQKLILGIERE